jgi:hypothetical protein
MVSTSNSTKNANKHNKRKLMNLARVKDLALPLPVPVPDLPPYISEKLSKLEKQGQ